MYEVIGESLDDFLQNVAPTKAKEARKAEGVKGAKVQVNTAAKEEATSTLDRNAYANHNIVAG